MAKRQKAAKLIDDEAVASQARKESISGDELMHLFFSSRRRHTRLQGDWSSDVCSSDLYDYSHLAPSRLEVQLGAEFHSPGLVLLRSEERRVGKECRSRWSPYH